MTVENVSGEARVILWGFDEEGRPHVFIDPSFKDHVYVAASKEDIERLLRESNPRLLKLDMEEVEKRFLGTLISLTKVSGSQDSIREAAKTLEKSFEVFEHDVRMSQKYILYRGVKPSNWYVIEYGDAEWSRWSPSHLLESIESGGEDKPPSLRVVAVDFATPMGLGEPDPKRDPLLGYAVYWGDEPVVRLREDGEYQLIKRFMDDVLAQDPDVIVCFMGNRVFYPFLRDRAQSMGLKIELGRYPREIYQSVLGHFSIGGRINIDLYEYVDDAPFLQMKTLEELSQYLSLPQPEKKLDPYLYERYWRVDRESLRDYLAWRVETIYHAFQRLWEDIYTMSSVTGIPLDYVLTSSSGRQIEFYIMGEAVKRGEVIPPQMNRDVRSYPGGLVLNPRKGLHHGIAVIDFKSMYPTIMIKYNISPETIVEYRGENIEFFEEVGLGIRRDLEGLLPYLLKKLLTLRDEARKRLKALDRSSPLYGVLDARQRIYKILANTVYGYMGWAAARWYSREGALLVTYLGRQVITATLEKAKELGLEVVYGDTDSLFLVYREDLLNKLLNWIEAELGMEAKLEKVFKRVIFTSAKKRYAGIYDGVVEIVGLEYNRRDWCRYARNLQYDIASEVLQKGGVGRSMDILRSYVDRLRKGDVDIDDLVIWEQITRPLDEYKANAPHIEVAKYLAKKGWKIRRGVFIGYVIHRGEGPIYRRAVYYLEADPEEIDVNYYINNQLIPAAHRVLEPIGVGRRELENIVKYSGRGLDAFL